MSRKGFTLVELLIVMFMGIIVMVAVYATMEMGQHSSGTVGRKVVTQQDTRSVLDLITMETRMASYNPLGKDGSLGNEIWVDTDGNTIASTNAKKVRKGIQLANKNEIMIEMDLDGSGKVECSQANEVIYYQYDINAKAISRQTGCGGNTGPLTPILGGAGAETMVVNSLTLPDATPLFRYFDNTDKDITDDVGGDQNLITNIRRIEITIVADTRYTDRQMSTVNRTIYSTSFIVRNHVL